MASYAVLTTLARNIDQTLNDPHLSTLILEKQPIRSLYEHVTRLRDFIDRRPETAGRSEGKITDLASRAEKVADLYMNRLLDAYYGSSSAEKSQVPFTSAATKEEMEEIGTQIEEMTAEDQTDADLRLTRAAAAVDDESTPLPDDEMIGFDHYFDNLKERLHKEKTKLEVIPIYGTGGIGKTTLAAKLHKDPLLGEYFDVVAWLRVSKEYDLEKMLTRLLNYVKPGKGEASKDKSQDVYQSLKGKRFFIVLDDVWNLDIWDEFRRLLPDETNGSRLLLTTRWEGVAKHADFAEFKEIELMNDEDSWKLLAHKMSTKIKNFSETLEKIGRDLAKIGMGLPLAIVVIAGILQGLDVDPSSWLKMEETLKSDCSEAEPLQKILKVSYERLPYHLRSCFLYMGFFSDYTDVRLSSLTKLWVAEGFLKPPSKSEKSDEIAAEEYLEGLVRRNIVFAGATKSNGRIKSCGIHDLVRDMCQRKAGEEEFLQHVKDRYPKRLGDYEEDTDSSNWPERYKSYADSMRAVESFKKGKASLDTTRCFRALRTLELMKVEFRYFPEVVLELFLLKYLGLGHVAEVPPSLSRLRNLEALVIHPRSVSTSYLPYIVCLPSTIWEMRKLRHLVSFSYGLLPSPEEGSCALEDLQTLNAIVNLECKEWVLKMIPKVKKMGIYFVAVRKVEYSLESLKDLQFLEKLKLSVLVPFSAPQKLNFAFPETLRKLTLRGCRLPWKAMTIISSLPKLTVLKLKRHSFQGNKWETDGNLFFPSLEYLLLEELGLETWTTEKEPFATLKSLIIRDCDDMQPLPDEVGDFDSIELIEIIGTNKILSASAKEIREIQKADYAKDIQVLVRTHA